MCDNFCYVVFFLELANL